jgi:hypothetical protein
MEKLFKFILGLFPLCIRGVEGLHHSIKGLGKIGKMSFTPMGITKNFSTFPHIDKGDTN